MGQIIHQEFIQRPPKRVKDPRPVVFVRDKYTRAYASDEKDPVSGANHLYDITKIGNGPREAWPIVTTVAFQKGPIQEAGVNGAMNEDLIAIVIDRLEAFQQSPYKCRENAIAITKLEEALLWLNYRTSKREARGVEGTHSV